MDTPARFAWSRNVGAYFGPPPRRYQSGVVHRSRRFSKIEEGAVRAALYEVATVNGGVIMRQSGGVKMRHGLGGSLSA